MIKQVVLLIVLVAVIYAGYIFITNSNQTDGTIGYRCTLIDGVVVTDNQLIRNGEPCNVIPLELRKLSSNGVYTSDFQTRLGDLDLKAIYSINTSCPNDLRTYQVVGGDSQSKVYGCFALEGA